ncbi:NAD(P)/FAD-dependent oxidoreductase [bacterium]|nr:NAD(P)/FAD-dependent oxidoreductase [bacterium]
MDKIGITIIGAGVVGLAIAAELSRKYTDIVIVEKNDSFGQETSSRNSEVIHAGIYYPVDSLKSKLCIEGLNYLYEICEKASIPHRRIGKLIIATEDSELEHLEMLFEKARSNGLSELRLLDKKEIQKLEPNTNAIAGIYSPKTGIVDSHSLMGYFVNVAKSAGAEIVYNSEVDLLAKENPAFVVGLKEDQYHYQSRIVINSAGLYSDKISSLAGLDIVRLKYRLHLCKGDYFCYAKASPVSMLIYPLPPETCVGLGVHATLDMGSRLRFGPDHKYIDKIDYKVDPEKAGQFYDAAIKIIPNLERDAMVPDMSGIRPKIQGPGDSFRDFIIKDESDRGLNGLIDLIGIESPGLTACVAIAKMVMKMVEDIMQ